MSHVYCPECGFQNPEAANYCARCGALLVKDEPSDETTLAFTPEDEEEATSTLEDIGVKGPALVVRSGGGRAGETFHLSGERTSIGRSPDCEIFLDDVTVSRQHALLTEKNGQFFIQDEGSLTWEVKVDDGSHVWEVNVDAQSARVVSDQGDD